jgi:hypothetical protein
MCGKISPEPAVSEPREPNPEDSVARAQHGPFGFSAIDRQLLPQGEVLGGEFRLTGHQCAKAGDEQAQQVDRGCCVLDRSGIPNSTGENAVIIDCARCVGKKPLAFPKFNRIATHSLSNRRAAMPQLKKDWRNSSNGVQSPRLQCDRNVTATYPQYGTGNLALPINEDLGGKCPDPVNVILGLRRGVRRRAEALGQTSAICAEAMDLQPIAAVVLDAE